MTEADAPGPLPGALVTGLLALLCLAGGAAALTGPTHSESVQLGWPGWVAALAMALAGAPLAAGNARLNPVMRHTFNLHYVILVSCSVFPWALEFAPLVTSNPSGIAVLRGLMAGSGAIALACLAASSAASARFQWLGAAAALGAGLGITGAAGFLVVVPVLLALAPGIARRARPMPDWLQGITGSLSFIAISVLALLGLGQLMVMLGKPAWQAMNGNLSASLLPPWTRPEGFIRFWIIRTAAAAAVGLLAGLAVFLWPRMMPGRWRQGLAAGCIVLAAVMAAHPPRPFPLLPILVGCLLIFGATSLSACLEHRRRWPASLVAVAAGFTIGLGWIHLPGPGTPMWLTLLWALDALPVVAAWFVAYLFGIRKLRLWAESSDR